MGLISGLLHVTASPQLRRVVLTPDLVISLTLGYCLGFPWKRLKTAKGQGVVAHSGDPSTPEAKAGEPLESSRPARSETLVSNENKTPTKISQRPSLSLVLAFALNA